MKARPDKQNLDAMKVAFMHEHQTKKMTAISSSLQLGSTKIKR